MLTGTRLIADVNECALKPGELALWWLGQHSFIVKLGATVVYIDPYLTPRQARLVAPLLEPREVTNADCILGSHDHSDHIDRPAWPALAKASPHAKFVLADLLRVRLARELDMPLDRFAGLDDGKSFVVQSAGLRLASSRSARITRRSRLARDAGAGGVKVSGIAAAHEFLEQDPATGRYPHLGCVLEGNGCALYHSGDCCIYEGLQTKLRKWRLDVVILPINGRDAKRYAEGCIGNMTYQEAADLAGALQPRLTIPAHYDMFANNLGDAAAFSDYMRVKYPKLQVHVCRHGERFVLPRAG